MSIYLLQIGTLLAIISSNRLCTFLCFFSFWNFHVHMLFCLMVSHKVLRLSSFFFFLFFFFLSSSLVILHVLSLRILSLSSGWSGLLLHPSSEVFQFSYYNFHLQNFCLVFLHNFCIFLIFSFCSHTIFLILFSCLSMLSFLSLNILMMVFESFVWLLIYSCFISWRFNIFLWTLFLLLSITSLSLCGRVSYKEDFHQSFCLEILATSQT